MIYILYFLSLVTTKRVNVGKLGTHKDSAWVNILIKTSHSTFEINIPKFEDFTAFYMNKYQAFYRGSLLHKCVQIAANEKRFEEKQYFRNAWTYRHVWGSTESIFPEESISINSLYDRYKIIFHGKNILKHEKSMQKRQSECYGKDQIYIFQTQTVTKTSKI